jgi:hypothetical protein
MKSLKNLVVAVILLVATMSLAGQASVPLGQEPRITNSSNVQNDTPESKLTVHSNLVFLPTRVQTKAGETVYGLRPEQFVVEDNGVRQSVHIEEDPDLAGLSLAVVVQCSRFAASEFGKLKGLGTMIDGITGDAPHEVAIVSYGEAPYLLGDFSGNPAAVQSALSRLKPCGSTAQATTIDAVYYAVDMLKRRKNHYRRAILLISENRDHGSRSKLQDVVAELGVSDTVIYSVTFSAGRDNITEALLHPDGRPESEPEFKPWPVPSSAPQPSPSPQPAPSPETSSSSATPPEPVYLVHPPRFKLPLGLAMAINALRQNTAPQLASLSGGEYMSFTTQKDFEEKLDRISNRIHNYYLLSFKPESVPTFGLHSLRVRVPDYPDAFIQTRKSYWSGVIEPSTGNDPSPQ